MLYIVITCFKKTSAASNDPHHDIITWHSILNIRFDMTARKKARSKKKSERHLWEKKTLKELFEWLQMNYYVEKKIVLSSLYSLLLHTTTTKLLRLKMKKKNRNFMNADWLCSERSFYYAPIWWCKSLYQKY